MAPLCHGMWVWVWQFLCILAHTRPKCGISWPWAGPELSQLTGTFTTGQTYLIASQREKHPSIMYIG